jgi:hypothetical protein
LNTPGYEQLASVLQDAFKQAAEGKGAERHANELPFHEQRMLSISAMLDNDAGMAYQVCKKITEARGLSHDARERELLGAIVYTAGMIIYHRERHIEPVIDKVLQATRESVRRDEGFDEARADIIGQNGNDGEHYAEVQATTTFGDLAKQLEPPKPPELPPLPPLAVKCNVFDCLEDSIPGSMCCAGHHTHHSELKPQPAPAPLPAPAKAPVALPNTDALVDPTGRPKWEHVPNWIKWIAQDGRGVWKGFEKKPEAMAGRWRTNKRWAELNSGEPLIGENWVHTLEERP